jgi:uncharacterized repeat protein (TIGR03803 family)
MNVRQTITTASRFCVGGAMLGMAFLILVPCYGAAPTFASLYSFKDGVDGNFPEARLAIGSSGVLYGTTYAGGTSGWGTVFELAPPSAPGGAWQRKILYNFTGGADGANPMAGVVASSSGVLYGTTFQGGTSGYGTVYQLTPAGGGAWNQKVLYSFTGGNDGANPEASLTLTSSSVLYGTTYNGGTSGFGAVFSLTPAGGGVWTEKVLYSFLGGNDGANPQASVIFSKQKVLYGTTYAGGSAGWGTVFQLVPAGGIWTESVLYAFTGQADGGAPQAGVVIGANGVLYGSTFWGGNTTLCTLGGYATGCGTAFQLTPPVSGGAWTESTIYTFAGPPHDGSHPYQNLTITGSGALWGTTFAGASSTNVCFPASYTGCGMVFQLKPPASGGTWTNNIVHVFTGDDGGGPCGVILNSSGVVYGATYVGGTAGGFGTVFSITPGGAK